MPLGMQRLEINPYLMDTLDMTTASMSRSQPIRTGSTAKRRRLRFVCLTGTQSLTKRGKLNSGALFLMEVKDEGTHPKPIDLQGRSTPPSDRLHAHDLHLCSDPKLLLSCWTYPLYFIITTSWLYNILLQKSLTNMTCMQIQVQLRSQGCKVS